MSVTHYGLLIGDQLSVETKETFTHKNPADTASPVYSIACATEQDTNEVCNLECLFVSAFLPK